MLEEFIKSYELKNAETLNEGFNFLKEYPFDVILLYLGLPDSDGINTFLDVHKISPRIPIIILTGLTDEKTGIIAVKKGAQDYLVKGQVNSKLLERSIRYSIERKKLEEELNRFVEELKRSNEELKQFAYITSHDLQEPLRNIASFAQLLDRRYKGQLDSDADEFIGYIVSGAKRMKAMIQGLLNYSHIGTGGGEFCEFDTENALKDAVSNLNLSIEECDAKLTYDSLPFIWGDESQISHVFQNLIGNALKFRKEGIPPKIHISTRKTDNQYVFSVQDNGIGIEKQYSDRIFEVFQTITPYWRISRCGNWIGHSQKDCRTS